jgi:eukaryotic-like serine/threonine-protein kinase
MVLAGRYRLGRLLGRGGMGAVYEAHDDVLDRAVAVKLLDVRDGSGLAVERFRREAKILAGLSHPNIVTVYDFGVEAGRAWIVMRLLPGPTLQTLVERRGRLPVDAAQRYTREAAGALAAAHAAGIVHRDVKPGNLMLAPDGSCTLVDLGIARLTGAAQSEPSLTQAGTILGTVQYVAPEIVTGGTPGPPADVYALGAALYTMLVGRPPFDAADLVATMGQHVHAPVTPPQAVRPEVPPQLDRLCLAMLAKVPEQRPTAATVAAELSSGTGRAAAVTSPVVGPTAPIAAGPAAAGTRVLSGVPPAMTFRPAPPGPPPARASRGWLAAAGIVLAAAAIALIAWLLTRGSGTPTAGPSTSPRSSQSSTPSNSPSTTSSSSSAPSTSSTTSPTDQTSSSSGSSSSPSQQQIDAALGDVKDATAAAIASGSMSKSDQKTLQKSYDDLEHAVHNPGTADPQDELDRFASTVDDLHANGAISDDDYNSLTNAIESLRQALGSSGG